MTATPEIPVQEINSLSFRLLSATKKISYRLRFFQCNNLSIIFNNARYVQNRKAFVLIIDIIERNGLFHIKIVQRNK